MNMVCFGDSNTYGYNPFGRTGEVYEKRWTDILSQITGWNVVNEGVNGREVPSTPVQIPENTDLYLVMLGTNDLLQLDTPEATAERMEIFLSVEAADKILLIAPPPMVYGDWVQDDALISDSIRLAQLYKDLAARRNIWFIDTREWNVPLAYDGVHFTPEGQNIFAEALHKEICMWLEDNNA